MGCILLVFPDLVFDLSLVYSGSFIAKTGVLSGKKISFEWRNPESPWTVRDTPGATRTG